MANGMVRQTMFSTGEVDEITWKRTDLQEYLTAAQSLKNCEVGTTGLAKKRKGTQKLFNASNYAVYNSRMYEFIDKNGRHYVVLTANFTMYIFDAPTDSARVVAGLNGENPVITGRGSNVVAHESGFDFIGSVFTPYNASEIDDLDYTQDNDSIIFTHPDHSPFRLSLNYDIGEFVFDPLDVYPYPAYDFGDVNYNQYTVAIAATSDPNVLEFTFSNGSNPTKFTDEWVNGQIIGGGTSTTDPIGYGIITGINTTNPNSTVFTVRVQISFQSSPGSYYTVGSQYSIKKPAWSETNGFPAKVTYYQSRLWFANTKSLPNTVFGSKINSAVNFDVGTGKDTDAIVYTIGINNSGAIQWMNGGKQLEIYCSNIECACPQDQNAALTPSTFSVKQQSSYGASKRFKPITYLNDSYYVNKTGKSIMNFRFDGVGLAYVASNVSAASSHLVKTPTSRALLRGEDASQDNYIYLLNYDDDTITAFQFAQSGQQRLAALTPIVFQRDDDDNPIVEIQDITTIDNEIYILKYYRLTRQFMIERFNPQWKLDCYRITDMVDNVISGLDELIGYDVQVIYQDQDYGEYTVADDGTVTIENNDLISGSVIVGLLYDVEIKPMYLYGGQMVSPLFKQYTRIYVDYYQSINFYINDTLVDYLDFSNYTIVNGSGEIPIVPQTGTAIIDVVRGWERFDTLTITQRSPYDLQILSIGYQISHAVI